LLNLQRVYIDKTITQIANTPTENVKIGTPGKM
jgi:hypothetical protein